MKYEMISELEMLVLINSHRPPPLSLIITIKFGVLNDLERFYQHLCT